MQKLTLDSAIDKYYLNGLIESAKWVIKDKSAVIEFISPNQDAIGKVVCSDFDLENASFGVYSTSQLIKLVKIMDRIIELKLEKKGMVSTELLIADNQYDLSFYLSDVTMIDKVPSIDIPENPTAKIPVNDEFAVKFINARKALGDIKQFTIGAKKDKLMFVIGEKTSYSNKVKYEVDGEVIKSFDPIPFPVDFFNEVLVANRGEEGEITVYSEGLMYIEFKSKSVKSYYFLIRLQEV
jgi:hypothetical protein